MQTWTYALLIMSLVCGMVVVMVALAVLGLLGFHTDGITRTDQPRATQVSRFSPFTASRRRSQSTGRATRQMVNSTVSPLTQSHVTRLHTQGNRRRDTDDYDAVYPTTAAVFSQCSTSTSHETPAATTAYTRCTSGESSHGHSYDSGSSSDSGSISSSCGSGD